MTRRRRKWILLAGGVVGLLGLITVVAYAARTTSHEQQRKANATPPPLPVKVATARARDVGVFLTGLGTVTPLQTVTVRSRVDGQLMRVSFREGQIVRRGDHLAEIDPRPFEIQLAQARGQLWRDQALRENAALDLERYDLLVKTNSIPRQQRDTQKSLLRQYEAAVVSDRATVDSAKLQLVYCHITAPISGRVGLRLVDPGNIVHATDTTGLVIIAELEPIGVIFTITEADIPAVVDRLKQEPPMRVDAFNSDLSRKLSTGSLLTIDNQVDSTTGTVRLKARFANADHRLFPSQFVNARLLLEVERGATVVPATAVQRATQMTFVYVVKPDRTVTVRKVKIGQPDGDDVVVKSGLKVGERVVISGAERLREGSHVQIQARAQ